MMRCDFTSDEEFYEAVELYRRFEEEEYYEKEYWLSLSEADEANKIEEEQKQGDVNE